MRHPFDALRGDFLRQTRKKVTSLMPLLEAECTRLFGSLLENKSWSDVFEIGVHALPSMNHLHIHILTPDHISPNLKTKDHYNSFTTEFFVSLSSFDSDQHVAVDHAVFQKTS